MRTSRVPQQRSRAANVLADLQRRWSDAPHAPARLTAVVSSIRGVWRNFPADPATAAEAERIVETATQQLLATLQRLLDLRDRTHTHPPRRKAPTP